MSEQKFVLSTVVWGEEYVDMFDSIALRSMLAPRNLPVLEGSGSEYVIHIDEAGKQHLENSESIKLISQYVTVKFIVISKELEKQYPNKFELMTYCHKESIGLAAEAGVPIIFINPDQIFSNNAIHSLVEQKKAGKRAVMVAGLRLNRDSARTALLAERNGDNAISLTPKKLVSLSFERLHRWTQAMNWDSDEFFAINPTHLYFGNTDEELIARCWHLHPLMVHPESKACSFESTIDDDFISAACSQAECVHVVTDSDEMVLFDLTEEDRYDTIIEAGQATPESAVKAMQGRLEEMNFYYFEKKIRFHTTDERFESIEKFSDEKAKAVMEAARQ